MDGPNVSPPPPAPPLCVDLDGTLVKTDVGLESALGLFKQNPLLGLAMPLWLLKGKAHLKHEIARRVDIDVNLLPFEESFLDYLRGQKAAGRTLVLATASNRKYADAIAGHVGLFDDVIASDATTNVSGTRKLARMREMFGERGFAYAGNAQVDLEIWPHAAEAILVNPERGVRKAAERQANVVQVFETGFGRLWDYLRAMRLYQWMKNLLLFLPLFAAHQLSAVGPLSDVILAFVAFGLCASSVYLVNDLLDLPSDRRHVRKRFRAIASGAFPLVHAAIMVPALLAVAALISLALPIQFLGLLALYFATSTAYSFWLKRFVLVDVLVLAGLYTLRIIAGAAAAGVELSFWLLAFSMFFFLSLALVKRYTELLSVQEAGKTVAAGRGYQVADLETLHALGAASAYTSVMVLALYVNSAKVIELYRYPEGLWLVCPLLLFWVSRVWLCARRGELHDDPVLFALRDSVSRCVAMIAALVVLLSA
ncbi:MAG: UbiA family prenyltransferase [Rhodospirillales bacterium]